MPIVEFSKRDMFMGKTITPGWYRVRVDNIGEAPAKLAEGKTPSINYPVEGTVLFNGDTGDTEFTDVPLNWIFNSKAIGFAKGFLEAFGANVEAGKRMELKSAEGRELDVFVENDTYQGRLVNRVNHKYRAPKADVVAGPKK